MPPGQLRLPPEHVIDALLDAPDPYDRAAVLLMAYGGLRVSEVPTVGPDDLERDDLGWWIRVTGKGGKTRSAPFPAWAANDLLPWLPVTRTVRQLQDRIPALMRAAGWRGTCHDLRHRYATQLLKQCHDVVVVKEALGHASVATTMVYCEADRPTATAAVEMMPRPHLRTVA